MVRLVTHNDVASRSSLLFNSDGADVLNRISQGCRNSIVGNLLGGTYGEDYLFPVGELLVYQGKRSSPIKQHCFVCGTGPGSCGGRDERQFFTGDTNFAGEASLLHYDLAPIYSNCARISLLLETLLNSSESRVCMHQGSRWLETRSSHLTTRCREAKASEAV